MVSLFLTACVHLPFHAQVMHFCGHDFKDVFYLFRVHKGNLVLKVLWDHLERRLVV